MGLRSELYFPYLKVGDGGGGRLGRSVAHRPGFAENRTEETSGILQGEDGSGTRGEGPEYLIRRSWAEGGQPVSEVLQQSLVRNGKWIRRTFLRQCSDKKGVDVSTQDGVLGTRFTFPPDTAPKQTKQCFL